MSALRFQYVFLTLMLLALISAFVLKPEQSSRLRPQIQSLFAPVTAPLRAVGRVIERRFAVPKASDPREIDNIATENESLRLANASLQARLDQLIAVNRDREGLGDVRKLSRPYRVTAADAGNRETLSIGGSKLEGLAVDQRVIYSGGIAGRISNVGVAGATVELITDKGARGFTGAFGRFQAGADGNAEFVRLNTGGVGTALVSGAGNNTLVVNTMTLKDAGAIQVGDWIVLADPAWPAALQGFRIGSVTAKTPRPDSPLFAKITIEPSMKLRLLEDVSVVVE